MGQKAAAIYISFSNLNITSNLKPQIKDEDIENFKNNVATEGSIVTAIYS